LFDKIKIFPKSQINEKIKKNYLLNSNLINYKIKASYNIGDASRLDYLPVREKASRLTIACTQHHIKIRRRSGARSA
jgi:hypothetical protein